MTDASNPDQNKPRPSSPKDIPASKEIKPGPNATDVTKAYEATMKQHDELNKSELAALGGVTALKDAPLSDIVDIEGNELSAWQAQTSPDKFLIKAKRVVIEYLNSTGPATGRRLKPKELYIVWFSKTLQNWKALVGTIHNDGLYFEVTYNGHEGETYVDVYQKVNQMIIKD